MRKKFYVYMMSSVNNRILYTGMTNDIHRRVLEHKLHLNKGFTYKSNITKLVFCERHFYVSDAIEREKQL